MHVQPCDYDTMDPCPMSLKHDVAKHPCVFMSLSKMQPYDQSTLLTTRKGILINFIVEAFDKHYVD